jgi:hypothetical protein
MFLSLLVSLGGASYVHCMQIRSTSRSKAETASDSCCSDMGVVITHMRHDILLFMVRYPVRFISS